VSSGAAARTAAVVVGVMVGEGVGVRGGVMVMVVVVNHCPVFRCYSSKRLERSRVQMVVFWDY